jgi:replicative DNA helicase
MGCLRELADVGRVAVLVVSAVARSKDAKGRSTYAEGLNLASFRESSELEFGVDDAYLLLPDADNAEMLTVKHVKSRHGEPRDIMLAFDRRLQRFTPAAVPPSRPSAGKLQSTLAALWAKTDSAPDDMAEDTVEEDP